MAVRKRIVCLANSRKLSGRCVAGREIVNRKPGPWIRPVSNRPSEEVSEYERQYADGSEPEVLDVIDIVLREPRPKDYQQENWLLESRIRWTRVGKLSLHFLGAFADSSGLLWINGYSTYHGLNDRVPLSRTAGITSSLKLIPVESVQLRVFAPGRDFGDQTRRVQARFAFAGVSYALRVTDPLIEHEYLAQADGDYTLGGSYLTISLGEPYGGHVYKLVAAIIEKS